MNKIQIELNNLKKISKDISELVKKIELNNNGNNTQELHNDLVYLDMDANDLMDAISDIQMIIYSNIEQANNKLNQLYNIFIDTIDLTDYDELEQNELGGGYKHYRDVYLQALYDNKISKDDIELAFNYWDKFMERLEQESGK